MLIAIGSVKSSPGVTISALALAAFRPAGAGLVIEADPAGGDVKAWRELPGEAGLAGLAAEARHNPAAELAARYAAELPGGLRVVTAPEAAEQAAAPVALLAAQGSAFLASLAAGPAPTVLDLGRLDADSPALGLLGHCDRVLLALRPVLGEITRAAARVHALSAALAPRAALGLILVGSGYPAGEIERSLGVPVIAQLPEDRAGAAAIAGLAGGRRLGHTKLARAARTAWSRIEEPLPNGAGEHSPQRLALIGVGA